MDVWIDSERENTEGNREMYREREGKKERKVKRREKKTPAVQQFALYPFIATINLSYRFPIFETSATTLPATSGLY